MSSAISKARKGHVVATSLTLGRPRLEGHKRSFIVFWLTDYANEYGHPMPDESQHIQLMVFNRMDVYTRFYHQFKYDSQRLVYA